MRKAWLACALVLAAGCPDVSKDTNEGPVPTVEFDPAAANPIVPFPNNLALVNGKVALPKQACESPAATQIREGILNTLDGFGTYELIMTTTLTAPPDPATVQPTNIVMYKIATGTTPVDPASARPVQLNAVPIQTPRFDPNNCSTPTMVDTIAILPSVPLDENSTYVVAVLDGLKPMAGGNYYPSPTWALVRQPTDPVTVDANGHIVAESTPLVPGQDANGNGVPDEQELLGLNQLWQLHAPALKFLDATGTITDRHQVLVAWTFTTQTTTDPLDPSVAGSPAAMEPTSKLGVFVSLAGAAGGPTPTQFLTAAGVPCGALPCNAIGQIFGGTFTSPSYQVLGPNPLPGGAMIPGAWTDPYHPTVQNDNQSLQFFAMTPASAAPAGGYPLVVFGHGLGSSKESLVAIGPQLAAAGFASIAIDFQASGSRAVRITNDPTQGCAGTCSVTTTTTCTQASDCPTGQTCKNAVGTAISPTTTQQCYAPILSVDLAADRDNIRQTVLDLERVTLAAKACGPTGCTAANGPAFPIDPAHVDYMGISLGGIIGSTTSAVVPYQGSVLNVAAVGWIDIVTNTQSLAIKCPIVNALIDLGVVTGTKWDPTNPTVGACTTNDWTMQPGFQQFSSIAKWILDPADGANFMRLLAPRKFVLQEVVDDQVVPNVATGREGLLLGQSAMMADPYNPLATPAPSAAITTDLMSSKWVQYQNLPPSDAGTGGFGNTFQHASLLVPDPTTPGHCVADPTTTCMADTDCQGAGGNRCIFPGPLGTARVQLDALTFLVGNH